MPPPAIYLRRRDRHGLATIIAEGHGARGRARIPRKPSSCRSSRFLAGLSPRYHVGGHQLVLYATFVDRQALSFFPLAAVKIAIPDLPVPAASAHR
jgi:hypothetical protein